METCDKCNKDITEYDRPENTPPLCGECFYNNDKITVEEIHDSYINGGFEQMTRQIDEYGYEFWRDYKVFLYDHSFERSFQMFTDVTIMYFHIKSKE